MLYLRGQNRQFAASNAMEVEKSIEPTSVGSFVGTGSGTDAGVATGARAGRRDGRAAGALRPLSAVQGELSRADGSARVRFGATDVLAAVYGPMDCPIHRQRADGAGVHVSFRTRDGGGGGGAGAGGSRGSVSEAEAGRDVRKAVEEAVLTALYPRKAVSIAVHVLCDDGGVLATAVNATFLALVDAGVAMRSVFVAVGVAVHNGVIVVDPEGLEEGEADGVCSFTFSTTPEKSGVDLVGARTRGDCGGAENFLNAARAARELCASTRAFLQLAVAGKVNRER